ncbi:hypothetical protein F4604DRAFT_1958780 [Suillus subluteus]|nr:hypothetical protein F4604DRAFT_1958780 [Suillus subluteus]
MTCSYTFVVTALIAKCINTIPGLHVRTTADGEKLGLDEVEIGGFANDFIEVRRDFMDWPRATGSTTNIRTEKPRPDSIDEKSLELPQANAFSP